MIRIALACALLSISASACLAQPKGGNRNGWTADFTAAKAEAKRTGKPILVVIRCEQCPDFAAIDEEVAHLDKEIADKFVRVRLTRIDRIDLKLFEFDYDLAWFAFFLNADEQIYGRYGGRDAGDPMARLTLKGMRFAMEQALEAHKTPPKVEPRQEAPLRPSDFAGARGQKGCIHCHNVNQFRRAELKAQGKWTRDELYVYPLPENIGLTLDVDVGNKVKSVAASTPAEKAGIKPGDLIKTINGIGVASFADASFGLHKAPSKGQIPIVWLHDGKEQAAKLELAEGWRKTNISWRASLVDILPALPLSGADVKPDEKKALGLPEKSFAYREDKFVHSTLKAAGLLRDDIIVGIDGKRMNGDSAEFLGFVRSNYLAGDQATLNVLRGGKPVDLPMTLK